MVARTDPVSAAAYVSWVGARRGLPRGPNADLAVVLRQFERSMTERGYVTFGWYGETDMFIDQQHPASSSFRREEGDMAAVDEDLLSLHRYFLAANQQRELFDRLITEYAEEHGEPPRYGGEMWNESWLAMSYWYAGLYVVIEGWRDLGMHDDRVDALLTSPNVDLLRLYRNGTFHYQSRYWSEKFLALIRDGEDVPTWVRELNRMFGRYFLVRFGRIPPDAP
jgi:hypothetical protein